MMFSQRQGVHYILMHIERCHQFEGKWITRSGNETQKGATVETIESRQESRSAVFNIQARRWVERR